MTIILGIIVHVYLIISANAAATMNITECPDGYDVYNNMCIPHSVAAAEKVDITIWIVVGTFLGFAVILIVIYWFVLKYRKRRQQNEKIRDIEMPHVRP